MKITLLCKKYNYQRLESAAEKVLESRLNADFNLTAEVAFFSKGGIKRLNQRTRGIQKITDVLSYPSIDGLKDRLNSNSLQDFLTDSDGEGGIFIGSIAICPKIARAQAKKYGHSKERELNYLTAHGLLHLLGYDHTGDDKELMRALEEEIMTQAGLER